MLLLQLLTLLWPRFVFKTGATASEAVGLQMGKTFWEAASCGTCDGRQLQLERMPRCQASRSYKVYFHESELYQSVGCFLSRSEWLREASGCQMGAPRRDMSELTSVLSGVVVCAAVPVQADVYRQLCPVWFLVSTTINGRRCHLRLFLQQWRSRTRLCAYRRRQGIGQWEPN